eukprot:TRINITY_DN7165_c0_g3_i1.p1 TRINITY_DN7165_c0_g3~~TRINITY_DN7165_c0_g3_i1.p1  ORF type:complete len:635 (-),score=101.42 TRINITY_DN7165_c0_g3_i1:603-2246(-)
MADLRRRLQKAQDNYSRYKTEYAGIVWQALELEDTIKNCDGGRAADWRFISTLREPRTGRGARILDTAEWFWRCTMRQQAVRVFAVILGAMSCTIIFAEGTIILQKYETDLSIFSILIKKAKGLEIVIQLLVMFPLTYICVCTYYSLFRLGMFSMYYFVPKHTDSVSLLMNCSLMSRYAAPMCKNFLSLIDIKNRTTFEQKMGEGMMLLGTNLFEIIVPLFMVVYTCLIMANVHSKVIETITRWARFRFEDDDDALDGFSATGLIILRRERAGYERGAAIGETVVPLARNFTGGDLQDLEAQALNSKAGSTSPYNPRQGSASPPEKVRVELVNGHGPKEMKSQEKPGGSPLRDSTPGKNRPPRDKEAHARGLSPAKSSPQRDKEVRGSPRREHGGTKYAAVRDLSGGSGRPPPRPHGASPGHEDAMGNGTVSGRPMPDSRRASDEGIFPALRWDQMKSSLRDMATAATAFTTSRPFGPLKGSDEREPRRGGGGPEGGANALTSSTSTLDNIFEGLRSKRLQEDDDDQDDLGNLLPPGKKKSDTYGRR